MYLCFIVEEAGNVGLYKKNSTALPGENTYYTMVPEQELLTAKKKKKKKNNKFSACHFSRLKELKVTTWVSKVTE